MKKETAPAPANRKPSHQRGKERVASLKAAALAVFADKGYDAATMTEIARDAGAAIGSLYQFFPTKRHLAEELHLELRAQMLAMLDALAARAGALTVVAAVDELFDELSDFVVRHPAFPALSLRRDIDPEAKRLTRAHMLDQIAHILTHAKPPLPKARARRVAVVLLELMKIRISLGPDDDAVAPELRAMLRHHFER